MENLNLVDPILLLIIIFVLCSPIVNKIINKNKIKKTHSLQKQKLIENHLIAMRTKKYGDDNA